MTYFNEEMIRKIRDKELNRKMETLVSYLLEKNIDSAALQADKSFFCNVSEEVIYPYIARAVLSTRGRILLENLALLTPEEASNEIFMTFLQRMDPLLFRIRTVNAITMHQTLQFALRNMVIDLVRKELKQKDDLQKDLFWQKECDNSYLMEHDEPISECVSDILSALSCLKPHHQLAVLGIEVIGCSPRILQEYLEQHGILFTWKALIKASGFPVSCFCQDISSLKEQEFTPKNLSEWNRYAKKVLKQKVKQK